MRQPHTLPFGSGNRREQRSLFGEILDWMLAPLLLLWPLGVWLTWLMAQGIANAPFDRELGAMARILARQIVVTRVVSGQASVRFDVPTRVSDILRSAEPDEIYYQVLGLRGELLSGDRDVPVPDASELAGPGELHFRHDRVNFDDVRIASLRINVDGASARGPLVQVAQTLGRRSHLATEVVKGMVLVQFAILPLAVVLVWLALALGIEPLNRLQQRIRDRDSSDLSPIDELDAPEEVAPLVHAINDLLARLDASLGAQKHFLADAAHQLKTPLAGLRTQAELAAREIDAGQRDPLVLKQSLQHIALSSQRAAHMVNQLLAMARAEDKEHAARREVFNLADLAAEVVRDFVPRAIERRIDLGFEGPDRGARLRHPQGPLVLAHALLLRELIGNLVDNALQYTPAGGVVTVRVVDDPFGQVVVLQVEDSGPGIAPTERELVFRAFYRSLGSQGHGSGLGLAIVREIAMRHDVQVDLEDANLRPPRTGQGETEWLAFGPGARFTLRFPAASTRDRGPT